MNIGGAVVGVALYLGGAAGILWLVPRSSRNLLDRKQAALTAGLQSAGASSRGTTEGGLYQGTDVSFELGGREVISNVRFVSESWVRANLRVKTGPLPWAIFSAERAVDRFGKLLGVNREVQTGDAEFDRQCYVDSPESDEVVKRLLAPPAVRSGISALLKLGFRVQTSTRGLEAYQVVSAYAKLRDFSSGEGAQRLLELADVMPPFDGVSPRSGQTFRVVPLNTASAEVSVRHETRRAPVGRHPLAATLSSGVPGSLRRSPRHVARQSCAAEVLRARAALLPPHRSVSRRAAARPRCGPHRRD